MEAILIAIVMMLVLGALLGFGLVVADRYLHVAVDERIETVTAMLPNYNCGSCGYPTCRDSAEDLVNREGNAVGTCRPWEADQKENIAKELNTTAGPD